MPTKWEVALGVIDSPVPGLNPYEQNELNKGDDLFDRFTSDPNWPIETMTYIRNGLSTRPGTEIMSWGAFMANLNALSGKPKTFVYVSDHSPCIPGPNALQFHGCIVSPQVFGAALPQGPNEQHVVVLVGGDCGRFLEELSEMNIPGNFIMASSTTGECPLLDEFDIASGMVGTDDPETAFGKEFNRLLGKQTPTASMSDSYTVIN